MDLEKKNLEKNLYQVASRLLLDNKPIANDNKPVANGCQR